MPSFDEPGNTAAVCADAFGDAPLTAPLPSVRDGWAAAREGYADNTFELRPDTGLIPGPRRPAALI